MSGRETTIQRSAARQIKTQHPTLLHHPGCIAQKDQQNQVRETAETIDGYKNGQKCAGLPAKYVPQKFIRSPFVWNSLLRWTFPINKASILMLVNGKVSLTIQKAPSPGTTIKDRSLIYFNLLFVFVLKRFSRSATPK